MLKRLKRNSLSYIAAALVVAAPSVASAMPWSWDMFAQPNKRSQKVKPIAMPEGTVYNSGKPLPIKDRAAAAKVKNPIEPTAQSIERGKARYAIYCATCHGDAGKGDGPVGQKYVAPTDLSGEYVQKKADGEIYYTITYGGLAIMPSYGDSVAAQDRWHIVNYIKHSLGTQTTETKTK